MLQIVSVVSHFRRGDRCLKSGDNGGALFHFSKVIQLRPRHYGAYHNRGIALQSMGTYASSIEDFDQAIRLNPRLAVSYAARGISRKFVGDWDGAIEDQTRALALDAKQPAVHIELGTAYESKGDFDRAIVHFTTAIDLAPRDPEPVKLRGCVQFCRGKFEAAAADLRRSFELGVDAYALLFYSLAQGRLSEQATQELISLAARLNVPEWPAPVIELYLGRLSERAVLDAAATPDHQAEAHFYIGGWHLLRNDREHAVRALTAAMQSLPPWFIEHPAAAAELARLA
jgi:lipoprotein NlpI